MKALSHLLVCVFIALPVHALRLPTDTFQGHAINCTSSAGHWVLRVTVTRNRKATSVRLLPLLINRYGLTSGTRKNNALIKKCKALGPIPTPSPTPSSGVTPALGTNADMHGYQPFPADNPWNADVSQSAVDPNSDNLIASIGLGTGLHPDFGTNPDYGIPYVVVNGSQPKVSVTFDYADESDRGPYPIPSSAPIEGGSASDGDRHILVIDRTNLILYETWSSYFTSGRWHAGSGAIFNLKTNALRPAGWTSADAAGLPIFPGLVRYDEVVTRGVINHALRFTIQHSRHAYVAPARHFASSSTSSNLPPMGMRVRLKSDIDISTFAPPVQVILRALKKYGMIVADNGSNWFISGTSDPRWDDDELHTLGQIKGSDFEVVKMGAVITN